jgi:predicted nucleic acid-binding protein
MTALVFVDTNVLLYARDDSEPGKRPRAQAWLEHLWQERLGRTSMQVLSECYVNLKRLGGPRLTPEEAWERVARYFAWKPLAADEALLRRARQVEQRYRLSWWDSMVVGAAQMQDCGLLLTEDLQDGAVFGGVRVRSPFTLAVEERAAVYAVRPVPATRHRAPGRPRRR